MRLAAVLLCLTLLPPAAAVAAGAYVQHGAWIAAPPDATGETCLLETGGYDRATKTQRPSLTLALKPGTGSAPHVELTATAVTRLSKEELTRVRPMLRVEGPSPMSVPAVPTALTETSYDRRLSVRPLFSRGNGEAGMAELIAAMRAGDRMQLEINGRALEPAFSLRGFDAIWRQLAPRCGAGAGAR